MGRRPKLRLTVEPGHWSRSVGVELAANSLGLSADPGDELEWITWDPMGPTEPAESTEMMLDAFVHIGRTDDEDKQREAATQRAAAMAFARRWGSWGWCADSEIHMPWRPGGFGVVPVRLERPSGQTRTTQGADWLPDVVRSAQGIDGLRRVAARLWGIRSPTTPRQDWRSILGPTAKQLPDDRKAETVRLVQIVGSWLKSAHVGIRAAFGQPVTLGVGGPAGGLAFAMLQELVAPARIAVCAICHVTHRSQADDDDDALCPTCDNTERNRDWRARRKEQDR